MLVIDGDKTLAPQDTGELFWRRICTDRLSQDLQWTAATVFEGPLGYSYAAFRQAAMHYEAANDEEHEGLWAYLAKQVNLHHEFDSLLKRTASEPYAGAMIVTYRFGRI